MLSRRFIIIMFLAFVLAILSVIEGRGAEMDFGCHVQAQLAEQISPVSTIAK